MSLKIRCPECRKKISVDEAFVGGVCRCPYCRTLAYVPGQRSHFKGSRPEAPAARTEDPIAMPAGKAASPDSLNVRRTSAHQADLAAQLDYIPVAKRVEFQGVLPTALLIGVLVTISAFLTVGVMYHYLRWTWPISPGGRAIVKNEDPNMFIQPDAVNPPPNIAGLELATPVLYVVDGGGSMRITYHSAEVLVRLSVRQLTSGQKFNLMICREDGQLILDEHFLPGGPINERAVKDLLDQVTLPKGAGKLSAALAEALKFHPKTIVLLARKPVAKIDSLIASARKQGTAITVVTLAGNDYAAGAMHRLATATGGQARAFTYNSLEKWLGRVPALD